jgi:aminoglycoside N3'-acetyltransferase
VAIDKKRLVEDFKAFGIRPGELLQVCASLRSVGWVEGGAQTFVEALLEVVGETGTLVGNAYLQAYPLPLSPEHARMISDGLSLPSTGAVCKAMIRHPRMYRSGHPTNRYVAIGAQARELMEGHTPESYAYDVQRIMAERGACCLRIGPRHMFVGAGTSHASQWLAGLKQRRQPLGVNYRDKNGDIKLMRVDWPSGCARGFRKFIPLYEAGGAIRATGGTAGEAPLDLFWMKKTIEIEVEKLSQDPRFFLCDDPCCPDCRLSWEFSDGNRLSFNWHLLLYRLRKHSFKEWPGYLLRKLKGR